MRRVKPPRNILKAFGACSSDIVALDSGQGTSFRCGDIVVKPVSNDREVEWLGEVLVPIVPEGIRLGYPVRSDQGTFVVDGWCASRRVAGVHDVRPNWRVVLDASRALHRAVIDVVLPSFLREREHWWAVSDWWAWHEDLVDPPQGWHAAYLRLDRMWRPVVQPSQLIHGDIAGNILFNQGNAPAIIDFSPYIRPRRYAEAIIAVDAFLWYSDNGSAIRFLDLDEKKQLLIRAALFRMGVSMQVNPGDYAEWKRYQCLIDMIERE